MNHECRYEFPLEKCLEMGCECVYSQIQAHFEFVSEQLIDSDQLDEAEKDHLTHELERCLKLLGDFHLMHPESSATDCSFVTTESILDSSTYIVFCSSCRTPIGIRKVDRYAPPGTETGFCGTCRLQLSKAEASATVLSK